MCAAALALAAACTPQRDRPGGLTQPGVVPAVAIVSPRSSDSPIPTPGPLSVRVQVTNSSGLLDQVSARAVREAGGVQVAHSAQSFLPPVGDTTVTIILQLEAFPTNTQLNLTATARVAQRTATSEPVPITTLDCSGNPPYCP